MRSCSRPALIGITAGRASPDPPNSTVAASSTPTESSRLAQIKSKASPVLTVLSTPPPTKKRATFEYDDLGRVVAVFCIDVVHIRRAETVKAALNDAGHTQAAAVD